MMPPRMVKLVSADGLTRYEYLSGSEYRPMEISKVCNRRLKPTFLAPDVLDNIEPPLKRTYEWCEENWDYERGALVFTYKEKI